MKILVTGGAGFLGSNLCRRLLKEGHEVVAVDNLITGNKDNLKDLLTNKNFIFIKHDICQPFSKSISHKLSAINQFYHLACPTGVPNIGPLAEEMLFTCSLGTKNFLELAQKNRAKFLFTSSSEIYGDPQASPQAEIYTGNVDPIGPRSPYEEGKRFAESLVAMYAQKYKVDAKIVRIFNTYGPQMSPEDTRVIPQFLRQALSGQPVTIQGRGTQRRTFCYVDDLVDGLILVMKKGRTGEVYNLGSDQQITIGKLAQKIIKITDSQSKMQFVKRPVHDHQSRLPALKKVKKLGWRPQINLEKGLKKTLNYYQ